jgi:hypothetical protein
MRFTPTKHTLRPALWQNHANDTMEEIVFAYARSHADLDDTEADVFLKDFAAHPDLHRTYVLFQRMVESTRRAVTLEAARKARAAKRSKKETERLVRELDELCSPNLKGKSERARLIHPKMPKEARRSIGRIRKLLSTRSQ